MDGHLEEGICLVAFKLFEVLVLKDQVQRFFTIDSARRECKWDWLELLLSHKVSWIKKRVSEKLFLLLHLAIPIDLWVLQTWFHCIAERFDDKAIQLSAAILNNGMRASPSLSYLLN